jgi:hypothetical protein
MLQLIYNQELNAFITGVLISITRCKHHAVIIVFLDSMYQISHHTIRFLCDFM